MSPSGRQSGEYAVPVTQEQFTSFRDEAREFFTEQREENKAIRSMLADGAATMAVLRADSETYKRRGDEASSKINLLIQKDKVREALENRKDISGASASATSKPTIWEKFKEDLINNVIKLIALAVIVVGYHEVALFMTTHPNITATGDGFSDPKHERGREPVQPVIPASSPNLPSPARSP